MLMMTTTKTMIIDRNKYAFVTICCGLLLCLCFSTVGATVATGAIEISETNTKTTQQQDEVNATTKDTTTVRNFSPRLEYNNEWRPLGRGDPLKNDPTYDYSPPALDRVRYWAENGSSGGGDNKESKKQSVPQDVLRNKTKSEILLLGVSNERVRGGGGPPPHGNVLKNSGPIAGGSIKAVEAPLLQPKYTSIRRSYFAQQQQQQQQQQQMPYTHLMPPPMHPAMPSAPSHHMMKHNNGAMQNEYRHSVVNMGSYMTPTSTVMHHRTVSQPLSGMMHTKPYYSTASTSHWKHPSTSRMPPSNAYDAHHQESMQHYSFTRPANNAYVTSQISHGYSPNAIHTHSSSGHKQGPAPRKPWLHELLQKEITKPVKPTMPATKYLMGSTKPHYEVISPGYGISSTYAPMSYTPISFVSGPPTIATPSTTTSSTSTTTTTITPATLSTHYPQNAVYITPTPHTEIRTPPPSIANSEAGFRPMFPSTSSTSTAPTPTYAPTPSSTTSNRLIIPTMSNLSNRPTIAPFEITTDALFKHYKQPKKPLLGPMYLIIEGHSKVKTYGQNELDPHQPKIVPIIPKREPVVRIADPNEKRGTIETFQVKHLHTKSTTPMPPTTTTTTIKTTTTTTTEKPAAGITTTSLIPSDVPMTDSSVQATGDNNIGTASAAAPPTGGMQDLLSLLNIFADPESEPMQKLAPTTKTYMPTMNSTVLKPVAMKATTNKPAVLAPQQPEPRISSKGDTISSLLPDDDDNQEEEGDIEDITMKSKFLTTEEPPRGTRQVFDYDQLPESRLKEFMIDNFGGDADGGNSNDDDAAAYDDDNDDDDDDYVEKESNTVKQSMKEKKPHDEDEDEETDSSHNLLKRIDSFLEDDNDDDGEVVDNDSAEVTLDDLEGSNEFEELADLATDIDDVSGT